MIAADKNNPRNYPIGPFSAHVGVYLSYGSYMASYQCAVEQLYQAGAQNEQPIDIISYPLLFLMRHSLELGYKYTLEHLYQANAETYNGNDDKHSLTTLHKKLGERFKKIVVTFAVPAAVQEQFNHYYEITRIGMVAFDRLDKTSFTFRYPKDTKLNLVLNRLLKVNLYELKTAYDAALVLLSTTADVLDSSGFEGH